MNETNIRRVATAILNRELARKTRGAIGFNMVPYRAAALYADGTLQFQDKSGHACNTVACIAGTAAVIAGYRGLSIPKIIKIAADFLGINHGKAEELFAPDYFVRLKATPEQAALVLFNLAETGQIDWRVGKPE